MLYFTGKRGELNNQSFLLCYSPCAYSFLLLEVQGKLHHNYCRDYGAVKGIASVKRGNGEEGSVKRLQEYHALIK